MELLDRGLRLCAAAGITTAQDGVIGAGAALRRAAMAKAGKLPIDVMGYPMYKTTNDQLFNTVANEWKPPGRFRLGGIKLTVDGSIQGYTAYLTKPYHVQPGSAAAISATDMDENAEHIFIPVNARRLLGRDQPKRRAFIHVLDRTDCQSPNACGYLTRPRMRASAPGLNSSAMNVSGGKGCSRERACSVEKPKRG